MTWRSINSVPKSGVFDVLCKPTIKGAVWTRYIDCAWANMNWGPQINPDGGLGRFPYCHRPTFWMRAPRLPKAALTSDNATTRALPEQQKD